MNNKNIKDYLKGKVLVLIDAANLESSVKSLGWWIDYIKGKKCIVVSFRDYVSKELIQSSDKYISLDKLEKQIKRAKKITPDIKSGGN